MSSAEIVQEITRLRREEQMEVQHALSELLDAQKPGGTTNLGAAARSMLSDYAQDRELTAFTALDSDDFHATQ